jgi:hypothetical protein
MLYQVVEGSGLTQDDLEHIISVTALGNPLDSVYSAAVKQKFRDAGIVVPFISDDASSSSHCRACSRFSHGVFLPSQFHE